MLCGIRIVTLISGLKHYSNLLKNVQKKEKRKERTRNKRIEIPFPPSIIFTFKQDTQSGALLEV